MAVVVISNLKRGVGKLTIAIGVAGCFWQVAGCVCRYADMANAWRAVKSSHENFCNPF